jgi:hypothetical protein
MGSTASDASRKQYAVVAVLSLDRTTLLWRVAAKLIVASELRLLLASQSPRRSDLLAQMGLTFRNRTR